MQRGGAAGRSYRRTRVAAVAACFLASAGSPASSASPAPSPPPAADFSARFTACLACHGESGESSRALTPSLGGQPAFYAMTQLFLLREGRRGESEMIQQARGMSNDDLRAFSEAISRLPPPARPRAETPDAARYELGRALAAQHRCGVCHNPDFSGRDQMPRLAHQREDYLLKAMREFRSGARLGYGAAMTQELVGLADADLAALAHFLAHHGAQPVVRSGG